MITTIVHAGEGNCQRAWWREMGRGGGRLACGLAPGWSGGGSVLGWCAAGFGFHRPHPECPGARPGCIEGGGRTGPEAGGLPRPPGHPGRRVAAVCGGAVAIGCGRGRRPRTPAPPLPGIGSDDSRRALPRHRFPEAPSAAPFPGGLVRGRAGSPAADALPQGALPVWRHSRGWRVPHKGAPFGGAASSGDPLVSGARLSGMLRCYFTLAPGGSGGGRGGGGGK